MNEKNSIDQRVESLQALKDKADLIQPPTPAPIAVPEKNVWGLSPKGLEAIQQGVEMYQTKHGLYSSIPMICKEEQCQYAPVCPILKAGLCTIGERCPLEISLIITRYDAYKTELEIGDDDSVDLSLLKDLIDYEVQILRAENKMAIEGDFVKDVLQSITESGDEVYKEEISQAAIYKDKIQTKRNRTLELLNSTRKDKSGERISANLDPSSYAAKILKEAKLSGEEPIEADFEELVEIEEPEYVLRQREMGGE